MTVALETRTSFSCFGGRCAAAVSGRGGLGTAAEAIEAIRLDLQDWHDRFTRFTQTSELSRLNNDPREEVPVSCSMAGFVRAVVFAAERSGGLVDATMAHELQAAGYAHDLPSSIPLAEALRDAPVRASGGPSPLARWRELQLDDAAGTLRRPPGVALDSGGIAKGLFADWLGASLASHDAYAVDCAGDLRLGGTAGTVREVHVSGPFDGRTLHTYELTSGGVATSGIGRRSWRGPDGRPAHHLLDPATGRPAFTGIVQVTALAPTALEAEVRAKAALLSGPKKADAWMPDGGVVVYDDQTHRVIASNHLVPAQRD